jgi:hypothetical protein
MNGKGVLWIGSKHEGVSKGRRTKERAMPTSNQLIMNGNKRLHFVFVMLSYPSDQVIQVYELKLWHASGESKPGLLPMNESRLHHRRILSLIPCRPLE